MKRIALVTGAGGSGIGAFTAQYLSREGMAVAVSDLHMQRAESALAHLVGTGHLALELDVTSEGSVVSAFDEVERHLGEIGVLVCSAGDMVLHDGRTPLAREITLDHWNKTFRVNVAGTFLCIREYLRRRSKVPVKDGRIITISSTAAYSGSPKGGVDYAASKAAVITLTKALVPEAAACGATVNCIVPGPVDTPLFRQRWPAGSEGPLLEVMPLGRLIAPSEVAALITFLTSSAAENLTGAAIDINGGTLSRQRI